jgi:hypothetical protein
MLGPNVRKLLIAFVGGAIVAGVACSSEPTRKVVTTGTAGVSGAAGASGAAGVSSGSAGDATGAAGTVGGTAGTVGGTGGSVGGTAGASGTAGSVGGTAGSAGGTAGAGTAGDMGGTAGAAVDNTPILPLPVAVTSYWYPSGWAGDANTMAAFNLTPPPITITDMSTATTGPCSHRVAGALGACYKITYTPVAQPDGGAPGNASVSLLANLPGVNPPTPNFVDNTMTPRVAPGAMRAAVQVAGDVGGENVLFNLGSATDGAYFDMQFTGTTLTTNWQQLTTAIQPGYAHILSPFGWGSSSTTPITFYYDDVRIDATAP